MLFRLQIVLKTFLEISNKPVEQKNVNQIRDYMVKKYS